MIIYCIDNSYIYLIILINRKVFIDREVFNVTMITIYSFINLKKVLDKVKRQFEVEPNMTNV
jgi:hypothetical protein